MKVSEIIKDLQDNFKLDEEVTVYSVFSKKDFELFYNDERPIDLEQWVKIATIMDTHEDYWEYHHANISEVMIDVAESIGWVYVEDED
jgi:hypothetical protein